MKKIKIVALMIPILFFSGTLRSHAEECPRIQNSPPDDLIAYLDSIVPDRGNAECVTLAIDRLGQQHYEASIPVLAKLLDFRRPPTEAEGRGTYIRMRGFYPAVNALEEIGQKPLPAVLDVIKADLSSAKARENAISVWMEIYKDESPKGVALLKQEADRTDDAAIKQHLKWALGKALTWCNPPDEVECKAAATEGR